MPSVGKLYHAIFSSEVGALIVSLLLALTLPILLFVFPLYSRSAALRLRKMRDEHIARSMRNVSCQADPALASRELFRALVMYAGFWLLSALFLAFGIGAYMVMAIPVHVLSFLATRSLSVAWRDLELPASRFCFLYLCLVGVTLIPGVVLFVLRYVA